MVTQEDFMDKFNNYFVVPMAISILLTFLSVEFQGKVAGFIIDLILTIFFIGYLVIIVSKVCKKQIKNHLLLWDLIISIVLVVLSLMASYVGLVFLSNFMLVSGIVLFETYSLFIVIKSCFGQNEKRINRVVVFSLIFIVLGIYAIYISTFKTNVTLFNALITIFSAIIGGGVTLVGVAWTIVNGREEKFKEEIQKAMPYFTFNILYGKPENIKGLKLCFTDILEEVGYDFQTYAEIENSDNSVVILKRIYHDNKWFCFECNNMLIQKGKLILSFQFSEPEDIILEVSDVLDNLYYYKLNVLHTALLGSKSRSIHTVRSIEKLNSNEVKKYKL